MPKIIECKRLDLLAALDTIMPAMERRNTIPIIGNVLLRAEGKKIALKGTDLDVTVECNGVARTGKDKHTVEMTVNAFDLHHFLKNAGADDLWMANEPDNNQVGLRAGPNRTLHTLPVGDFPTMKEYETPARFEMGIGDMLILIKTIKPAISTEDTRYYLGGMFFEPLGEGKMCVVATDGHRLHTMNVKSDGILAINTATKVIVPAKTISVVEKWLTPLMCKLAKSAGGPATLFVEMGNGGINFRCGTTVVRSKVIDGTFPDWRRVVPKTKRKDPKDLEEAVNDKVVQIESSDFEDALKIVSAKRGSHSPGIKFKFGKNEVELSRNDPDSGKINTSIACVYEGEPIEIGFNASYVRDIIKALDGGRIEMIMADAGSPTIIRKVGVENPFCVLMPMRV
jgi:DNA polymerase-3 subunit beta